MDLNVLRLLLVSIGLLLTLQVNAVTFKIATLAPDGTAWMQAMRQGAAEIKKQTQNRVVFRFYPGGVMGDDKSVLRKIKIGQLQGGALTAGGIGQIYPDVLVYGLPFQFKDFQEVDFVRQNMDQQLLAGLEKKGYVSFGFTEGGFAYLFSQQAIQGPADLAGRKVWSPVGDTISRVGLESLGVTPIQLPLTDVLTGLQTRLIDTVGNSPVGTIALQWHTKVSYLIDLPLFYLYGALIVQNKAFKKLSAADQKIVRRVMQDVFVALNQQSRKDNEGARKALQQQGLQFIAPLVQGDWQDNVATAMDGLSQQGFLNASLVKKLRKLLTDYRYANGN